MIASKHNKLISKLTNYPENKITFERNNTKEVKMQNEKEKKNAANPLKLVDFCIT